jgi:hypothetical protein
VLACEIRLRSDLARQLVGRLTAAPIPVLASQVLDDDTMKAVASPAGFAFVATRNDVNPYIPEKYHLAMSESIVDIEQGRLELLVLGAREPSAFGPNVSKCRSVEKSGSKIHERFEF